MNKVDMAASPLEATTAESPPGAAGWGSGGEREGRRERKVRNMSHVI